ncbi:hypothetical protein BH10PSE14_BH10PSE14_22280 [soil metagenome]
MDIADFLWRGGTDKAGVAASVEAHLGLAAGDVLLAAGSLAEGLGTVKSDLDLFLITDRVAADGARDEVVLSVGRCVIDVRILPRPRVTALIARLRKWALGGWDPSDASPFSHDERVLLHRLAHGLPWTVPADRTPDFRPPIGELSLLKLHVARHAAKTIQVDLEGYRQADEHQTMALAAQKLLGHAVDGLLAGWGYTNPISKWRSRLLGDLPAGWEEALLCRPARLSAPELFWRLQQLPDCPDDRVLGHTDRILAFARAVFLWAEAVLLGLPVLARRPGTFASGDLAWEAPLAPLLPDVDFSLAPTGVLMARLNEFQSALDLDAEESALVLLFDGITTQAEAARAAGGGSASAEAARRVEMLAVRLAVAGLCRDRDARRADAGVEARRTPAWTR